MAEPKPEQKPTGDINASRFLPNAYPRVSAIPGSDLSDPDYVRKLRLECLRLDLTHKLKLQADPEFPFDISHHVRNIRFLIKFYEDGGEPPKAGETRYVRDGQFANVDGQFPPTGADHSLYTADRVRYY